MEHTPDYMPVTEAPGNRVRREAIDMLWTRYAFAAELATGQDVLEVGCGPGPGLGYLAGRARRVVGGDYTERLVRLARQHYGNRLPVLRLDGQELPFADASFGLVLLFETLYYLRDQAGFVKEARRVLHSGGQLVIVSVNPRWVDFNPSPLSTTYLDSEDIRALMQAGGFDTIIRGAFRSVAPTPRDRMISVMKRAAVSFGLVPKTMKGKEGLKRLFFGRLEVFPAELSPGMGTYFPPEPVSSGVPCRDYKVLYGIGTRR